MQKLDKKFAKSVNRKNSHQKRWQIPRPKAAWAWVNLANSILLKMKLDLSFLYALYWYYLFNRCMIIKHWAKNYCKLPKRGKNPKQQPSHYGSVIDTINSYSWNFSWVNTELQIIFTVVSVFTKENFNPFSNLISPFGIGTHEIQWLFSIFLTHNWSPIYLLL